MSGRFECDKGASRCTYREPPESTARPFRQGEPVSDTHLLQVMHEMLRLESQV